MTKTIQRLEREDLRELNSLTLKEASELYLPGYLRRAVYAYAINRVVSEIERGNSSVIENYGLRSDNSTGIMFNHSKLEEEILMPAFVKSGLTNTKVGALNDDESNTFLGADSETIQLVRNVVNRSSGESKIQGLLHDDAYRINVRNYSCKLLDTIKMKILESAEFFPERKGVIDEACNLIEYYRSWMTF